jgi:hypothetical protein
VEPRADGWLHLALCQRCFPVRAWYNTLVITG